MVECPMDQWRKMQPPSLKGIVDALESETQIKQIQKIFMVLKCSEEQKVHFATFMLEGEANHQWEMTKRILGKNEEGFVSWEAFLEVSYEKYFHVSVHHQKEVKFHRLV